MIFKCLLLIIAVFASSSLAVFASKSLAYDDTEEFHEFLEACTIGNLAKVESVLTKHPSWAKRNDQAETCLHAAGIMGHADVTEVVLKAGGDPNIWTSMDGEHKISALSYHVFGGHVESAKVLLKYGADPNGIITSKNETEITQTPLDTVLNMLKPAEEEGREVCGNIQAFYALKDMLVQNGGKRFVDLQNQHDEL